MSKSVNETKDCCCPLSRDYWSGFTHGDITKDGTVVKVDIVKTKGSDGSFIGSNFI